MNADVLESIIASQLPAATAGDTAAYSRIVAATQRMVTSIALAIVRDAPASEDIAQEAFLKAWQNLHRLENPASFLPWLRQITRNLSRDHLRAATLRANPASIDVDEVIASVADPSPCPAELAADEQEQAVAAAVIDALPDESREVLLLYYREGRSSRQVAALLGLQDAAVRKRLSRARERIREELLNRLGDFAKATAPGVAFTTAVTLALAGVSPPAAAATAFGAGVLGGAKGLTKLGVGAFGFAALGIAGGLAGVWFGIRKWLRAPFDDREKRELTLYGATMSALVIVFAVGIVWMAKLPGWLPHLLFSLAYMAGIGWGCSVWLPRILSRRQAAERARDPVAAADAERRARRRQRIGFIAGYGLATLGLLLGLFYSGRL
ncbi:RNA polymerase sigma factor [Arenimonas composti]|uniref:RNA polymerase sigma factor n=1 Tax=Arenimonas composti TR7-09 = DSM 18010 TaxID=1121013 RepID=A0A091BG18_9GAMM|nr:sigma-70 family RNA polymerase sigma factor [Arenimonas composti]KFN50437.1 hypothetical protein P873_07175 [Arenimonas composti TR7-09 = DSM 18010]